ncbi:hypothetical protein [Nocardioides sp.]|uniref:hypothetical protein n=1 Tax=Nocardioides sp. TaxID=35761 RepID=UPI0035B27E5A
MTDLSLHVEAPAEVPLGEAVVVVLRLRNDGSSPATTSSRLDLAQGDLSVWVAPEGGDRVRVEWPWQVDSGRTEVDLAPGQELVGSALLLSATGSLFPAPGDYAVLAAFAVRPDLEVTSAPATVRRVAATDPGAAARQRALEDPDVVRSLASVSTIGAAAEGLALLAASDASPVAQLLAACVTTVTADLPPVIERAVDAAGAVIAAAAVAAVLPPGVFPGDERLAVAEDVAGPAADPTVTALLSGSAATAG